MDKIIPNRVEVRAASSVNEIGISIRYFASLPAHYELFEKSVGTVNVARRIPITKSTVSSIAIPIKILSGQNEYYPGLADTVIFQNPQDKR